MKTKFRICVYVSLWLVGISVADQKEINIPLLETHFNAAIEAKGDAYFELRKRIIEYEEDAKPFLLKSVRNDELHTRVIARALLSWMNEDYISDIDGDAITTIINAYSRQTIVTPVLDYSIYGYLGSKIFWTMQARGGHESALLYGLIPGVDPVLWDTVNANRQSLLLEAAIKGLPPRWEKAFGHRSKYAHELARMFAASLSGAFPCTDTPAVLAELLESDESWRVRMGAARGLERIGDIAVVVPPLIKALRDQSADVRSTAYIALRNLIGDDIAFDSGEFTHKVGPKQIEAVEKWWDENQERVLREGIRKKTAIEKFKEWISTDDRYKNLRLVVERESANGEPRYGLQGSVGGQREMRDLHMGMERLGLWREINVRVDVDR